MNTKAEVARRVGVVYKLLVAGLSRSDIITICNEKHGWHAASRTFDDYIARATARFTEEVDADCQAEKGKALARYLTQYRKADERKDHRGAAQIIEKIVVLMGLAVPKKTEITLHNIPLSELDAEIARLEAELADDADDDAAHDG